MTLEQFLDNPVVTHLKYLGLGLLWLGIGVVVLGVLALPTLTHSPWGLIPIVLCAAYILGRPWH